MADHPLQEGERDDDATAWAEAFCRIKRERGWSLDDIDEGLMVGWFANAIERACSARSDAADRDGSSALGSEVGA